MNIPENIEKTKQVELELEIKRLDRDTQIEKTKQVELELEIKRLDRDTQIEKTKQVELELEIKRFGTQITNVQKEDEPGSMNGSCDMYDHRDVIVGVL